MLDDFREYPGFKDRFTSKALSLTTCQTKLPVSFPFSNLGDFIIREILAVNQTVYWVAKGLMSSLIFSLLCLLMNSILVMKLTFF